MKTTIDLADGLFHEAKQEAAARGTTLRALIEEGLRSVLDQSRTPKRFRLRDGSVGGEGLQPGVDLSNWPKIRAMIYNEPTGDDE
jgi:hypothetical protein